jgi:transcription elongation GreA/GreB family factor
MTRNNELLVSRHDAEALALVLSDRHLAARFENETDALAELLMEARLVPHDELPRNCVALNSRVTYREQDGPARTVTIVHPAFADPAKLRISVLSPVARALLGRRRGDAVTASVPRGPGINLEIVAVERTS